MADAIPIEQVVDQIKQDVDWVFKAAYARGYNTAKAEIALSGEYERAYQRGKADAQQWIPCTSTKRPKNREEVMVTIDDGYQRYTDTDEFVNGQYWYHDDKQVVAWKPFDDPWKGEQDG